MILVVDNYDSFTYNLVQALGELGAEVEVRRNDIIDAARARQMQPERIIVSPGPCTPREAGASVEIIRELAPEVPILGVCLGHQSLAFAFGGEFGRAEVPVHGKTSTVEHDDQGVFAGVENPFTATRYHSLLVREESLPDCLVSTSHTTEDGVLMGIRHREYPVEGVQFHPESFLTTAGQQILRNFLKL